MHDALHRPARVIDLAAFKAARAARQPELPLFDGQANLDVAETGRAADLTARPLTQRAREHRKRMLKYLLGR